MLVDRHGAQRVVPDPKPVSVFPEVQCAVAHLYEIHSSQTARLQQRGYVTYLIVVQAKLSQVGQPRKGDDVTDLVFVQTEQPQSGQVGERLRIGDPVSIEMDIDKIGEIADWGQITDQILGQIEGS